MKQYLLTVYHPDDTMPATEEMEAILKDVNTLNDEIRAAGAWVFGGGLHPPVTATVLRVQDGEVMTIDGPFAETKEHMGGFWIIQAADLDAALGWGRRATRACALPVEVRPFQEEPDA